MAADRCAGVFRSGACKLPEHQIATVSAMPKVAWDITPPSRLGRKPTYVFRSVCQVLRHVRGSVSTSRQRRLASGRSSRDRHVAPGARKTRCTTHPQLKPPMLTADEDVVIAPICSTSARAVEPLVQGASLSSFIRRCLHPPAPATRAAPGAEPLPRPAGDGVTRTATVAPPLRIRRRPGEAFKQRFLPPMAPRVRPPTPEVDLTSLLEVRSSRLRHQLKPLKLNAHGHSFI
jgi:hypothetical protein